MKKGHSSHKKGRETQRLSGNQQPVGMLSMLPRPHTMVKVSGDCIDTLTASLGETNSFCIHTPSGSTDSPGVSMYDPAGKFATVNIDRSKNGEHYCSFVPKLKGSHKLMICYGQMNIPGSPFVIDVQKIDFQKSSPRPQYENTEPQSSSSAHQHQPGYTPAPAAAVPTVTQLRQKLGTRSPEQKSVAKLKHSEQRPTSVPVKARTGSLTEASRREEHRVETVDDGGYLTPVPSQNKPAKPPKPRAVSLSLPRGRKLAREEGPWQRVPDETKKKLHKCLKPDAEMTIGKELGKGQFGQVFEVRVTEKGKGAYMVAAKTIKDHTITQDQLDEFMAEALLMHHFQHINVLELIGVVIKDDFPFILVPLMSNGSLRDYLKKMKNRLELRTLLNYCTQIAKGMEYIASLKFVHRDLAARNCLLNDKHVVKIADFGLARDNFQDDYVMASKFKQLPLRWMAPEIFQTWTFTSETDVWSFGVLLWEIFTYGETPYNKIDSKYIVTSLLAGSKLEKPDTAPDEIFHLMFQCWDLEPSKRPKFSDIVQDLEGHSHQSYSTDI